jgi:ATP-dependent DNA helicase RecQ
MHDQVTAATQTGLPAAYLNSSQTPDEANRVWSGVRSGQIRLLYVSPERLAMEGFRALLHEVRTRNPDTGISLFAVDEAHCISEWGHEFRPDYRALANLRSEFAHVPIAAFTATATPRVQEDVIRLLGLRTPTIVRASFDRTEIFYRVSRKTKVLNQIRTFVLNHRGESGIVYRATRKDTERTAVALNKAGVRALPYHAGLSDEERRSCQEGFVRDEIQVVVATIAFGMGIDKADVRWIVHGDLPRSLEAYYQETGRAGRDGDPAEVLLLHGGQDLVTIRYHIDRMENEQERDRANGSLQEMLRFANARVCRRIGLLAHFAEEYRGECGNCDNCTSEKPLSDRTIEAQKVMSAMVRTGERFGAHHIADIVVGAETDRILQLKHDRLPTFGVGSETSRSEWIALLGDLEAADLVSRRDGPRSGLALTGAGRAVLRGDEQFLVRQQEELLAPTHRLTGGVQGEDHLKEDDLSGKELFSCLRALRTRLARERGVPPYVVFSDRSLREMASFRPNDHPSFLTIHGVGDAKAARYGEAFLTVIREYAEKGGCPE